jgi:putative transposase
MRAKSAWLARTSRLLVRVSGTITTLPANSPGPGAAAPWTSAWPPAAARLTASWSFSVPRRKPPGSPSAPPRPCAADPRDCYYHALLVSTGCRISETAHIRAGCPVPSRAARCQDPPAGRGPEEHCQREGSPGSYLCSLGVSHPCPAGTGASEIVRIHEQSRSTYGRPRVHAELRDEGSRVNHKRVGRLMRVGGVRGVTRRRRWSTTTRDRDARPAPDLVERNFTADGPDQLWVADITFVPTGAGFLFLAVVLDAWSRRMVGWAMASHLRTSLVLQALEMALGQRRSRAVIHHSGQGTQYTSIAFGLRCKHAGVRPSIGSVGDAYDNAMCESFFATLECELLERERFQSQAEARMKVFDFTEGWYNPRRRHSALGYRSPNAFERDHAMRAAA